MIKLLKEYFKDIKTTLIPISILVLATVLLSIGGTLYWQFWLIFDIILYLILIIYFAKGYLSFLNIHLIAVSLIMLYALPSVISIIRGSIALDDHQFLVLLSSIGIGLIGYIVGVIIFRGLFPSYETGGSQLSKKLNAMFWLAYKYRYILAVVSIILFFQKGFMSYAESVVYRMETSGVMEYSHALPTLVFSVLSVAIISIVGDISEKKRLSLLSYLLIVLVIFSTLSSTRIWIITIGICLAMSIFFYPKKKIKLIHILLIVFVAVIVYGVVVAIPHARSGSTAIENIRNIPKYFLKPEFLNIMNVGEFGSFKTFVTIVKNVPQNMSFHYDAYINDFLLLIPTIIYPDRPLPPARWYVQTFYPELFYRGGGRGFSVIGFGYLFAGPIGVLIHLFLFGLLFEALNKLFRKTNITGLFLYSYFFVSLFSFVRGDGFITFIKNSLILYLLIPLALLFIFVALLHSINMMITKVLEDE
ncbi:O-antigen polymerase [Chloroflexota bacterium]